MLSRRSGACYRANSSQGSWAISTDPFAALRAKFLARCREELPLVRRLTPDAATRVIDREALLKTAHSLAGAAGTFGFPDLSMRAASLETLLLDGAGGDEIEIQKAFDELVKEMERSAS